MDAESTVDATKAALGPLTRAIPIGSSYGSTTKFDLSGFHGQTSISTTAVIYIAWFQKQQKPMTMAVSLYANDRGQKAYGISEVNAASVARQYAVPVLLFVVSLFLLLRGKSSGRVS